MTLFASPSSVMARLNAENDEQRKSLTVACAAYINQMGPSLVVTAPIPPYVADAVIENVLQLLKDAGWNARVQSLPDTDGRDDPGYREIRITHPHYQDPSPTLDKLA